MWTARAVGARPILGGAVFALVHLGVQSALSARADPVLAMLSGLLFVLVSAALRVGLDARSRRPGGPTAFMAPLLRGPRPSGGFARFTEPAQQVIVLACGEARRFNHDHVGAEHLLLGLIDHRACVAAKVLANLDVDLDQVRSAVEIVMNPRGQVGADRIELTSRALSAIELAIDEARRLGHTYIGTDHLLLGIVREGEGVAAGVLRSAGVSLDAARVEVLRVLSGRPRAEEPGGGRVD